MSLTSDTDRLARSILGKALNRELDGQHDRVTSIALSLLLNPGTREVGKGLVRSLFMAQGSGKRKNQIEIPHPIETLALVAEMQFPASQAKVLWDAICPQRQVAVMTKIISYAVMNDNPKWVKAAISCVEGAREGPEFNQQALGHQAIAVIRELQGLNGIEIPDEELANPSWKMVLPWLLKQVIAVDHENLEYCCEWISKCLKWQSEPLPIEAAIRFAAVDPALYPALATASALARRELLGKQSHKKAIDQNAKALKF